MAAKSFVDLEGLQYYHTKLKTDLPIQRTPIQLKPMRPRTGSGLPMPQQVRLT